MTPRDVVLLGSTGSVGTQALDLIAGHPDRFTVAGLAAGGRDLALLGRQIREHAVPRVAVTDPAAAVTLRSNGSRTIQNASLLPKPAGTRLRRPMS